MMDLLIASFRITLRVVYAGGLALILTLFVCVLCRLLTLRCTNRIGYLAPFTRSVWLFVLLSMALPVILRVLILPLVPEPFPVIHDEYGHLLVADTLGNGRLANPPHPLSRHLETIYVLQRPTYSSIYPLGQGLILAAGKVLAGSEYAGVLLATALMCGIVTWTLYGCLPPFPAAAGGIVAAFYFGLGPWANSFWGGSFAAFGGGLVFGSLWRLVDGPSRLFSLGVGAGLAIIFLIRPFEGLLPLLLSWVVFAWLIIKEPCGRSRWAAPVGILLAANALTVLAFLAHNRAVTGSPLVMPYHVSQATAGVPQTLLGQKPVAEPPILFKEAKESYDWQRAAKNSLEAAPLRRPLAIVCELWRFFVAPWFILPLLLVPFSQRDAATRFAFAILVAAVALSSFYAFFFPHYFAAYTVIVIFLVVRGSTELWKVTFRNVPVGSVLLVFVVAGALSETGLNYIVAVRAQVPMRKSVLAYLTALGGRHVAVVTYGEGHTFHDEWVYNEAAIDSSQVVWVRASDSGALDSDLVSYFKDRKFWRVRVGKQDVQVSRYHRDRRGTVGIIDSKPVFVIGPRKKVL